MKRVSLAIMVCVLILGTVADFIQAAEPAKPTQDLPTDAASVAREVNDAPSSPRPSNLSSSAAPDDGTYPTQLAGYDGSVQPTRYGPQRNDPAVGTPEHAYSPFAERNNREHPCPPGGCEMAADHVVAKLAPQISPMDERSRDGLTSVEGVKGLSRVFPNAEAPQPGERILSAEGDLLPKPDLTRWYRVQLDGKVAPNAVVEALKQRTDVAYAEPDYLRKPVGSASLREFAAPAPQDPAAVQALPGSGTDPLYDQQWHLGATQVPQAWQWLEDNGYAPGGHRDIVVAVIDTGVDYTHPDLAANMWVNPAEFNGDPGVDDDGNGYVDDVYGADTVTPDGDPVDDHGHGTHVAGIIAAQANNSEGGVGIAYNTKIMAVKAAQYSGILASSDIAKAITYAVEHGADVINMSFGGYARSQVEEDALAVAFGQAVLVGAAGNDGKVNLPCPFGRDMYPAAYNWVLGVMAHAEYPNAKGDFMAGFSNYDCDAQDSHEYELMAPGVDVWSTLPDGQYAAWDGTSMATPVVSGLAALARTRWYTKSVYSSRFIMGQLATTGPVKQAYTPVKGPAVFYHVPDAYAALTTYPEPKLSYLEHWLFDTEAQSATNDDDGIVDAGETVDLGIVIRNHWGKADPVTVTLEAWAEGAVQPDPYVTMITDTVSYGAVGSFNIDDNGLIYANDVITGVDHPFRFTVPITTPNDHVIPFKLTMTAGNGYEPDDPGAPYVFESRFYLIVQRGVELPRIIDQDMTLTKDYYYLVPDATLIEEGATVTVTEGTQIQFFSSTPRDPYSPEPKPMLQVEGDLKVQGTAAEPVEMFTGLFYQAYPIIILQAANGNAELRYARIMNPLVGSRENPYDGSWDMNPLNLIDHSYFTQEVFDCIYHYDYWDSPPHWSGCYQDPIIEAETISHSIFRRLGPPHDNPLTVDNRPNTSLYDANRLVLRSTAGTGNVFLKNYKLYETQWGDREYWVSEANGPGHRIYPPTFLRTAFPAQYDGKTYVALQRPYQSTWDNYLDLAEFFANQFGGHVVTVNDAAENEFLQTYQQNNFTESNFEQTYPDMDCGDVNCWYLFEQGNYQLYLGLNDTESEGQFSWISGEPVAYTNWYDGQPDNGGDPSNDQDYVLLRTNGQWYDEYSIHGPVVLELPGTITQTSLNSTADLLTKELAVPSAYDGTSPVPQSIESVTPFLDLPITYGRAGLTPAQSFAEALQGNVYGQGAGRVNAWFDHASPDYTADEELVLWTGTYYTNTLADVQRDHCTVGAGCYDGHNGVDFSAEDADEPVFPSATGTVVSTMVGCQVGEACGGRYGNQVWIDHGNGYATLYGHLNVVSATVGMAVNDTSTPLGTMGVTGDARGTHLHFGVYYDQNADGAWTENEVVDPFGWIGDVADPWGMPNDYLWIHPLYAEITYNPAVEATLVSPSGQISITLPTGRFTSTVNLQLWEIPLPIETTRRDWGGGNYHSLGRTFWLTRSSGEGQMQSNFETEISVTLTSTRHLRDYGYLFRSRADNNRWDYAGGNDLADYTWLDWTNYGLNQYDLQAELECDNQEHNDRYDSAVPITTDNAPIPENRFDMQHDQDWFRFQAVVGERYLIRTSNLDDGVDTYLEVYDQDGFTVLATDDDGGDGDASSLQWEAPADGTYFIRVTPATGSSYGCDTSNYYSLSVNWLAEAVEAALEAERQQIIAEGTFNKLRNNAFLNVWWDPNVEHWMQFDVQANRGYRRYINGNYWGTTATDLIYGGEDGRPPGAIIDSADDFNKGLYVYQPILTEAPESAYPFVADVRFSTDAQTDTLEVGAETVTFTVSFNRDMDTTVQPAVSFGPDVPETDYTVTGIDGGWRDPRTWVGTVNITPITGDGYQFMRIAGAVAADDPWLVTGDDTERFRFEVITSGSEAMNLQATGGEGYVDLMWTQDDFDLLSGFNLYRSTSISGTYTRLNESIIPPGERTYQDTNVDPGQPTPTSSPSSSRI
jgi:subtilisin family serine protease/murein DD-endopeptidase MepM/ murein hydrolase activator NlpD